MTTVQVNSTFFFKLSSFIRECDLNLNSSMEILSHLLTVVLDDAFEVVGHQVPQGTFVGQTQTVREHDGRVYD